MAWYETAFARRLGVRVPIVQAPMAGGPATPRLAAAVSEAGGLGSVAGALLAPDELRAAVRETRRLTSRPFAVNLFAPLPPPSTDRLDAWSRLTGAPVPEFRPGPSFPDQVAVLAEERVPIVSVTFGCAALDALAGTDGTDVIRVGTATTVAEAVHLERAGYDAVVAQGFEAGGHRGSFLEPPERSLVGTLALVPQVVDAVSVPVVASGGIMDGRGIAAALALGAQAVQMGTAFLACPEAGTTDAHQNAVGAETTLTRVLTGRLARSIRTPVVDRLEGAGLDPPDYPLPRFFLSEAPMLAGQAGVLARRLPAAELVGRLERETGEVLARLA
jgi:nitronate monooxygenase